MRRSRIFSKPDDLVEAIAPNYTNKIRWDVTCKKWFKYDEDKQRWRKISKESVASIVLRELRKYGEEGFSYAFITRSVNLLKLKLIYVEPPPDPAVLNPPPNDKRNYLYTTEKEYRAACYNELGFYPTTPASKKKAKELSRKVGNYRRRIIEHNCNWIDIHTKSQGKYRYQVCADCVEGFSAQRYRYTFESMTKVRDYLRLVPHKTTMAPLDDLEDRAVVDASFQTMEAAETFANLLSSLEVKQNI